MTMVYSNDDKIILFGEFFIKNNKDNCFLLINDKMNELCEEYNIFNKKEKIIKVQLIEVKYIENMSYMFYDCLSLISVDMSKWNKNKIKNLDYMFLGCQSLYNLSGISKWDTTNVISMNRMFLGCNQLEHFPNVFKRNIKNEIKKNEILLIYNIRNVKIVRIFGEEFVKNNEDNCKLIIKDQLYKIREFYENIKYLEKNL